jgi:hypothetical protein
MPKKRVNSAKNRPKKGVVISVLMSASDIRQSVSSIGVNNDVAIASTPKQAVQNEKKIIASGRSAFTKKTGIGSRNNTTSNNNEIELSEIRRSVESSASDSNQPQACKTYTVEEILDSRPSLSGSLTEEQDRVQRKIIPSGRSAAVAKVSSPPHHQSISENLEDNVDSVSEKKAAPKIIASGRAAGGQVTTAKSSEITEEEQEKLEENDDLASEKKATAPRIIASGRTAAIPSGRTAVPIGNQRIATSQIASGRAAVPRVAQGGRAAATPLPPSSSSLPTAIPVDGEEGKEKKGMFGFGKKK